MNTFFFFDKNQLGTNFIVISPDHLSSQPSVSIHVSSSSHGIKCLGHFRTLFILSHVFLQWSHVCWPCFLDEIVPLWQEGSWTYFLLLFIAHTQNKKYNYKFLPRQFIKELFFFFFFFFFFLGQHLQRTEISRLGLKLELHCRATTQPQLCHIQPASVTYTKTCSNARSLAQWSRQGIKPTSSWILVRLLTHWVTTRTPKSFEFTVAFNAFVNKGTWNNYRVIFKENRLNDKVGGKYWKMNIVLYYIYILIN